MTTRLLIALALLTAALGAEDAQAAGAAKATISRVSVGGSKVSVRGRVKLPRNTARQRRRTRVLITLTSADRKVERFKKAKINRSRVFKASRITRLTGSLTLAVRVTIGGRQSGKVVKRRVRVAPPPLSGPLKGTFKLDAGTADSGKPTTGTWFQMLQSNGTPLQNFSSPSANKDFTPLSPGTDGGLRTDVYQGPPSPAFAGGNSGNALARRIIKPVSFFNTDFSIVTAPTDPQVGAPDPLPEIKLDGGKLSGQVTAWAAQWNGQSFNQGTPKPDGSTPAPTTPLSGTYDSSNGRFVLSWKSLIVGGPFNGFTGSWHLEGIFQP
jgi:hypothetical protein